MRIFITTILPQKQILEYGLSIAANNFSSNLISGVCFGKVYSILALSTNGKINNDSTKDSHFELVYNYFVRNLGSGWTKLACILEQYKIFKNIPSGSIVWTYNVNSLNAFIILLLKVLKPSVQINAIVLDFTPAGGKGLNRLYLKLINTLHGVISLSYSELFTCKNRLVLPGVVPINSGNEPLITNVNHRFLLSGVLNDAIAQIHMVLNAFSQLPQCELHITGITNEERLIDSFSKKYPNIIFHGKTSYDQYYRILHDCTFLLSTRSEMYPENNCNFPSKIIESLLHNRIVISTIKYRQLQDINYFVVGSSMACFKNDILDILSKDDNSLLEFSNQGRNVKDIYTPRMSENSIVNIENAE